MKYCKNCITTSLRPNSEFDKKGYCIACSFETKDKIPNYKSNRNLLISKISKIIDNSEKGLFDCIVGVSGGKDSIRQALWVRDNLGLNPLLVCCSYPPVQMTDIGGKNLENIINSGFDCEIFNPAPETSRILSKESFFKFGNVCKHTEKVLFATVTKIAIEKKIPIAFWGENPSIQEGDSKSYGKDIFDANEIHALNTLSSGGDQWIIDRVGDRKAKPYIFPINELRDSSLSMLYLGPAWDDWSMTTNSAYASLSGMELRPNDESLTGDITNASMLDEIFTNINMMIKYYKFGFGRASDLVNEEIRKGTISREEGIEIACEYDGICSDVIIEEYCSYIKISKKEFWKNVTNWTNKKLFYINGQLRPNPKFKVGSDFSG